MPEQRRWRWTEADPLGRTIHCGEREWQEHILVRHSEVGRYEAAVRATLRTPDAIYDNPHATAKAAHPTALVQDFYGIGYTGGYYAGKLLRVIVKWLPEGPGGQLVGYLRTAYLTDRIPRWLQWHWGRELR